MNKDLIIKSVDRLNAFVVSENYSGYDPYDILNSWFNFNVFGKWGPPVAIQVSKKSPFNFRGLAGVKKGINPKGMGLFLKAYTLLYRVTKDPEYKKQADYLFNWLKSNTTSGFSGACWGYNFDWASPGAYHKAFTPSAVVTAFVVDGLYEYYKTFGNEEAAKLIHSAAEYTDKDLPVSELDGGISIAYTHASTGACYNASLLGVETLVKSASLKHRDDYLQKASEAVKFVLNKQKDDGRWNYSVNISTGKEREQIDFHQGYVCQSLYRYNKISGANNPEVDAAVKKGLEFYYNNQFFENGRAKWRLPALYPADIHNQSQGIISLAEMKEYSENYLPFAGKIAEWTIENMQDKKGYFYYQKFKNLTNKIPYIRWAQAWMLLAFAVLLEEAEQE